ncbi:MAG: hypothetical protein KDA89_02790 [Planctomycetaceae bacterium]|nr:hypothetical protein [Planctomycetaceae bacterium]
MCHRIRTAAVSIWLLLSVGGCHTAAKHHLTAISEFDRGDSLAALQSLDAASQRLRSEKQILAIDRAITTLTAGDPAGSETLLRESRRQLEFLEQKDIKEQTASVLTDDKAVSWKGREFERRMIDNLLVLSSLLGNEQDAFAYSTQVMEVVADERQALLPDQPVSETESSDGEIQTVAASSVAPPPRLMPNAFSAYLHAAVHSERAMDADVTDSAIRQVSFWTAAPTAKIVNAAGTEATLPFGSHSTRPQHGVVHVITFVGRVTDWEPETAEPTTAALLIADRILSVVGDHTLPPTVAPVKIARPVQTESTVPWTTAIVATDNDETSPAVSRALVDLNQSAYDSYLADRDEQIARAVARRIVKKGAVYAAKNQMAVAGGTGVDLLMNVGGIIWEAMEKADTRHVTLLPERIEAAQIELPVGPHTLELSRISRFVNSAGRAPVQAEQRVQVHVQDGRNVFILCFRPQGSLTSIVVSADGK